MSTEIVQWVLERSPYRGVERTVHFTLAHLADEAGVCLVTTVGVGRTAGVRRHTVTAVMRKMVRDGLLELAGPPNRSHSPTCCRLLTPGANMPAHGRLASMSHGRSPSMNKLAHGRSVNMSEPQTPSTNLAPDPDPDPNRILPSAEVSTCIVEEGGLGGETLPDSGWLWKGMSTATNGTAPPATATRKRPAIPFPPHLTLTPKLAAYATNNGLDPEYEWGKFKVHALQDDRRHVDWIAAWKFWVRNAWEYAQRRHAR